MVLCIPISHLCRTLHTQSPVSTEKDESDPFASCQIALLRDTNLNNPLHSFIIGAMQQNVYRCAPPSEEQSKENAAQAVRTLRGQAAISAYPPPRLAVLGPSCLK